MKSWFATMNSSLSPFSLRSSPKCSRHCGSNASRIANSDWGASWPMVPLRLPDDVLAWLVGGGGRLARGDSGGDEDTEW